MKKKTKTEHSPLFKPYLQASLPLFHTQWLNAYRYNPNWKRLMRTLEKSDTHMMFIVHERHVGVISKSYFPILLSEKDTTREEITAIRAKNIVEEEIFFQDKTKRLSTQESVFIKNRAGIHHLLEKVFEQKLDVKRAKSFVGYDTRGYHTPQEMITDFYKKGIYAETEIDDVYKLCALHERDGGIFKSDRSHFWMNLFFVRDKGYNLKIVFASAGKNWISISYIEDILIPFGKVCYWLPTY